jgi:hypothetical protein
VKVRATIVSALCAYVMLGALGAASAAAGTPLYPDLQMRSPSEVHLDPWDPTGNSPDHHFLLFATDLTNAGQGALEIHRIPTASGIADLIQRIYESPVGFRDERIGAVAMDPTNTSDVFSFPVPDIARYELWTESAYRRAAARKFSRGRPLFSRDVSYCLVNWEPVDTTLPSTSETWPPYATCYPTMTGLSAGWRHHQSYFDADQWIDLGLQPLPDGNYVLRAIADPTNRLIESAGKADPARDGEIANSAVAYLSVVGGQLAGIE